MADRRRNLLHKSKLAAFVAWAREQGYLEIVLAKPHPYEVARLEKFDPSGNCPHIVIYRRERGDHLTTTDEGTALVKKWLTLRDA